MAWVNGTDSTNSGLPPIVGDDMSSTDVDPRHQSIETSPEVGAFCDRHHITDALNTCLSLTYECFELVGDPVVGLESDRETDEERIEVEIHVAGDVDQNSERYDVFTDRWIAAASPGERGRIVLVYYISRR